MGSIERGRKKASQQKIRLLLKGGEKHAGFIQKRPLKTLIDDTSGQEHHKEKGKSVVNSHPAHGPVRHFCTEQQGLGVDELMPFRRWQRLGIPTLLCLAPFVQTILLIS